MTLAAVVNSMIGCSNYVDLSVDEISDQQEKKVDRIVFASTIDGVVLRSDKEVRFDDQCGIYDDLDTTIAGVTDDGEEVLFNVNRIKSVLVTNRSLSGAKTIEVGSFRFVRDARHSPWRMHNYRSVQTGKKIMLRNSASKFDPETQIFTSKTTHGQGVAVSADEVYLQDRKTSAGKTVLAILGIGALIGAAVGVYYLIELSKWDGPLISFGG
jgi:hypothetical protein